MITATDLFAGAGGSTEGLTQAGVRVEVCANHWPVAVATHALNHPDTEHRIKDLSEIDWRTFPSTDVLWASPSCGQGFPDSFEFTGTAEDVVKQIGNAVPVGIARWLGKRAVAALDGQAMLEVAA